VKFSNNIIGGRESGGYL